MRSSPRSSLCWPCALFIAALGGCWKDEYAEIPDDVIPFQPSVAAPEGWLVAGFDVGLECPDGEPGRFYLLYPQQAEGGDPIPGAILYHSGAFDFVFAPDAEDPLLGTHFADPSRLTSQWATRQVFATLGMYPEQDLSAPLDGALPAALAEAGVAVMLPANCWGDLWANKRSGADNDFAADFFFRDGRSSAEWSFRYLTDPLFADAFDVILPVTVDTSAVYAIGLGEGSRAVAELLSVDNAGDGTPDYTVTAAVVDSPSDDLRVYFEDEGLYASVVEGLSRVFPSGPESTASGSFWSAPMPDRIGWLYSSLDPYLPASINDAALERLDEAGGDWLYVDEAQGHILSNSSSNTDLASSVVTFLIDGTKPQQR